jgi:hypothetical protein
MIGVRALWLGDGTEVASGLCCAVAVQAVSASSAVIRGRELIMGRL